jgi:chromosome partitioning protein
VRLTEGLARAARREISARVLLNRTKRTQLARHAAREIEMAGLPLLTAALSDLVAYGKMTFSGRVPDQGLAGDEVSRLIAELRALGWLSTRQDVLA